MERLWINGEFMPLSEGRVPVEERSLQFADGIYEVIAAYNGVPVLLDEHLDRWERSAEALRLESPYDRQTRTEVVLELVKSAPHERLMIYGQLSRGFAPRMHQFPSNPEPLEYWYVRELPEPMCAKYPDGAAAVSCPDERWSRCWIKSTCLLPNVLAKQLATEKDAFEAILYREDGTVTEGSAANFYGVKDGVVRTHPDDGKILGGIKRQLIMQLAGEAGIPVSEKPLHKDELAGLEEAFLSSTTLNVLPVTAIDGKAVGDGKPGEISRKLLALVEEQIVKIRERGVACL